MLLFYLKSMIFYQKSHVHQILKSIPVFLLFAMILYSITSQSAFTCSKLTIETLEQGVKYRSGVFIVNFENISHAVLMFLLLTLNM